MVASLHYLETLFLQYDRNQGSEGFIVFEEAERAYGRFANFLKLMIHKDTIKNTTFGFLAGDTVNVKDNIAKYTFYYLLTKGQLPESSWSTKSDFLFKKLWGWDFQLDRLQLFQVFKVISEQVKLENKEKEEQLCSP
jgi:hypothetical protein